MGRGAIVIGLAAVIIGKVVFEKLFQNFALKLLSVVLGAVIYYAVLQVVIWFGLDTDLLKLLSALVVALFLALPYWKKKYIVKPVKKEGFKMLEVNNIYKTFNPGTVNEKLALDGLSLKLKEGDFVTVIGGNGAGNRHF